MSRHRNPMELSTPAVAELWHEFAATRRRDLRDRLVLLYHPLVLKSAWHIHERLPAGVEVDDLISVGTLGLLRGIELFDPFRGSKAVTYLITKIRGAMIDDLRALDVLPRSRRNKVKRAEAARALLQTELGRLPTPEEIAERTGIDAILIDADEVDPITRPVYSLDVELFGEHGDDAVSESVHQDREPDPHDAAAARDRHPTLLDVLTAAERDVITQLFYDGHGPAHVAAARGISHSRVCQLRIDALDKIHGGRTFKQMKEMLAVA